MFKAINDRIIVKLDEVSDKHLLLLNNREPRYCGTVVDVGKEVNSVKVGEHIIFHPYDELDLPQDDLVIVREKSVLAVIDA